MFTGLVEALGKVRRLEPDGTGGTNLVLGFAAGVVPQSLVDLVASFSFLNHFDQIKKGVIDLRDLIFFLSVMGVFLYANTLVLELKKGR